jgi:SAM-dependent methyltransferase
MARLLTARGSDKATVHDYHHLYGAVLVTVRETEAAVLEIGLGTNNTDMVSNMGPAGVPGASLRAFRDFLPRGQVFGADVDKRILFSEERIGTFYVDQTKPNSFGALDTNLGGRLFDLVIDEGLHSPNANIATLTFALQKLKPGGHAVIEDIHARSLPIWDLLGMILPRDYVASILQAKEGFLFVVRKAAH